MVLVHADPVCYSSPEHKGCQSARLRLSRTLTAHLAPAPGIAVPIRSGRHDGERDTSGVDQHMTLGPHFFPGPWGLARRTPLRGVLWSWPRRYSASPRRSRVVRRTPSTRLSRGQERIRPRAIRENSGESSCHFQSLSSIELSIGTPSGEHTRFLRRPSEVEAVFSRHRVCACTLSL